MADQINLHIPCIKCGYDLFAVAPDGNCTECGSAKALSIDPSRICNVAPHIVARLLLAVQIWLACIVLYVSLVSFNWLVVHISIPDLPLLLFGMALVGAIILAWNSRQLATTTRFAVCANILFAAALLDLLLIVAFQRVPDFRLPDPLTTVLLAIPPFGFHVLLAVHLSGVPSRIGARLAVVTACGICCYTIISASPMLRLTLPGSYWSIAVFVICAYGTLLSSLVTSVIAWKALRNVMRFREQYRQA